MHRSLITLLAAAFLVLLLAILVFDRPDTEVDAEIGAPVLPGLADARSGLESLTIRSVEGSVTLQRVDRVWRVMEADGYPVDFARLDGFVNGLAEATVSERKTAIEANHPRLGLAEVAAGAGAAIKVQLGGADYEAALLLGHAASNREGQYFRRPGDAQSWLMDREVTPGSGFSEWLQPVIIDVDADAVRRVHFAGPDGEVLDAERADDGAAMRVLEVPEDRELRYQGIGDRLARGLDGVRLESVLAADDEAVPEFDASWQVRYELVDGASVKVQAAQSESRYFLQFSAEAAEADAEAESADAESGGQPDAPSLDVASFNERVAGRVFEVTEFTYQDFAQTLEDQLAPPEDAEDGED